MKSCITTWSRWSVLGKASRRTKHSWRVGIRRLVGSYFRLDGHDASRFEIRGVHSRTNPCIGIDTKVKRICCVLNLKVLTGFGSSSVFCFCTAIYCVDAPIRRDARALRRYLVAIRVAGEATEYYIIVT